MLKKLLKYDLKYMFAFLGLIYLIGLIFAILTRVFSYIDDTVVGQVLYQISSGAMFAMIGNALVNAVMRSWLRFSNTIYKDESYLTHTLPVSKKDIYESKFIMGMINIIATFVFGILCAFIAFYSKENMLALKGFVDSLFVGVNISPAIAILIILFTLYVETLNIVQCGYTGIIEGSKNYKNKKLWCFLKGLIIYTISQIIVLLIVFMLGFFVKDIGAMFTSNTLPSFDILKGLIVFILFIYLAVIIILNIINVQRLNKGVNVD